MKGANTQIGNLLKSYKQIQKDPNMSPVEKRARLDQLDGMMNEIAGKARGSFFT